MTYVNGLRFHNDRYLNLHAVRTPAFNPVSKAPSLPTDLYLIDGHCQSMEHVYCPPR